MKLADIRELKNRLLGKVAPEDEWWKPYGSKERAYDLDWGDAICEYSSRELPNILNGSSKVKDWPWTDSPWMKDAGKRYWQ